MNTTCPVCNNAMEEGVLTCPSCGYRLQDATEQFSALHLDGASAAEPAVSSSAPTLTVLYGKQEGLVYTLSGQRALIGRSPKCEVFLNDMTVSRTHALLERVGEGWSIKDDASFNGVWVNNVNVDHTMLKDRDIIQIGCFVLRYAE